MAGLRRGFLCRFLLTPSGESLLLVAVVRAGLFLVLLTLVTVEKQNLLRVAGTHTDSFRRWRVAVKRITMQSRANHG